MTNKRPNRSDHYQHLLLETVYSNDMMEAFCNEDSISAGSIHLNIMKI